MNIRNKYTSFLIVAHLITVIPTSFIFLQNFFIKHMLQFEYDIIFLPLWLLMIIAIFSSFNNKMILKLISHFVTKCFLYFYLNCNENDLLRIKCYSISWRDLIWLVWTLHFAHFSFKRKLAAIKLFNISLSGIYFHWGQ